jgi:hypothetical protein
VAVLSDIHAHSKSRLDPKEAEPSYVEISAPESAAVNPFAAVEELVRSEGLTADVLVCAGDMGDKATPEAVQYAWKRVRRLQSELQAPILLAATGNHDMDSRAINDYDARGILLDLDDYPFQNEALNNEYWAHNVVVQTHPAFRSVLLNSSAYHGYVDEWQHGRISRRTREYLRSKLEKSPDPGINLLVTHHQLYKFGGVDLGDQSEMRDASALLDDLGSGEFGSWLVIHGHRHWPAVSHAGGGRAAPVVFSAGSFSAVLYAEIQSLARNQFYLLEIEDTSPGYPVRGRFRAWDWVSDHGFLPAQQRSGLAHSGGFGGELNGTQLADKVHEYFSSVGAGYLEWADVRAAVPEVSYAMPSDFGHFQRVLSATHGLELLTHANGDPAQIGKVK